MYKSTKNHISLSVLALMMMFLASCKGCQKEIPEQIKYIPAEATVVASVNMKNITLKVAWESITDFNIFSKIKNVLHQYGLSDEIDDPEKSGVSILDNYYFFFSQLESVDESYIGAVIPLSNATKFHNYIHEKQNEYKIQQKIGYEFINIENRIIIAWTGANAILVAYKEPNANIETKIETLVNQTPNGVNLYNTNSSFEDFQVEQFDVGLWVNAEPIYIDYLKDKNFATQRLITNDYFHNSYITSKINFEDGLINWDYEYHLNDKSTEFYNQYSSADINTDIVNFIPTKDILGILAFTVDIEGIVKTIKENKELVNGYTGMIRSQGYEVEELVDIFKGDFMVSLGGFQIVEEDKYDWVTQTITTTMKAEPDVVFGASLKNKALLEDLVEKLGFLISNEGSHYSIFGGSAFMFIEGEYVYGTLTNSMKGILISNKQAVDPSFKPKIDQSNLSIYVDLENCVASVPKMAVDSNVYATIQNYKNDLSSLQLKVNGIKDDVFKGNLVIRFQDEHENSLYTLLNMTEDIDEEMIP